LPYHNSYAYREIQRVHRGDYKWSRLVGAWVGRGDYAARGVPEWFLDPSKASKPAESVLAPIDGAVELKVEDKDEKPAGESSDKPADEPRLEPVEEVERADGDTSAAPQAVGA
jgi:vacuolar protein sorting-associated protein 72